MIVEGMRWDKKSYAEYQQYLISLKDEKYQVFNRKLVPTVDNIIGIRVPDLRALAKNLKKTDMKSFLQVMEHGYFEERMLHGFVVGEICKERGISIEEKLQLIWEFIPYIDNWAVCDSFCSSIKMAQKYPEEMLMLIQRALAQDMEYSKRFGYVMLLDAFMQPEYLPLIFDYCTKYIMETYYVQMAVAWLLSMCYVKDKDSTLAYLRKAHLDDFTYRKTISKIIESNKVDKKEKQWVRENLKK